MKRSYKRKSNTSTSTETPSKTAEITGVSRSGRVRKKSSKLIDYESGAEDRERPKRKSDNANVALQKAVSFRNQNDDYEMNYSIHDELGNSSSNQQLSDSEQETNIYANNDGFDDSSIDTSGTDVEDSLVEDKSNVNNISASVHPEVNTSRSNNTNTSTSRKSLYMQEKFAKKKKNGRGTSKAGRKDKGKARFSAYLLWAREVRPDLMKANPNIDFSQLSSKLSDLWATVPYTDKYMWKKKAKRMAFEAKNSDSKEEANIHKAQIKTTLRKKYMNKKSETPPTSRNSKQNKKNSPASTEINNSLVNNNTSNSDARSGISEVSTEPLDVAAHLKLLGDSLSIVGRRLKEHQGAIAVSGSLSVLLDTLLCSMGPLLCLTQQVDEMNGCTKETLTSILDNIAYIMPGL